MSGANCKWQDWADVSSASRWEEEATGLQSEMIMKKIKKKGKRPARKAPLREQGLGDKTPRSPRKRRHAHSQPDYSEKKNLL